MCDTNLSGAHLKHISLAFSHPHFLTSLSALRILIRTREGPATRSPQRSWQRSQGRRRGMGGKRTIQEPLQSPRAWTRAHQGPPPLTAAAEKLINDDIRGSTKKTYKSLCAESLMVSAGTQVSLLRKHGGQSPGQLFSLSLVEAKDGWSRFSLSKAGQLIQQWWLPCNFKMAKSHAACSMGITSSLDA